MNKGLLIALIYKDLEELKVLAKGFSEMENVSKTLVDLSVDKAKNIVDCLQKLLLSTDENMENSTKTVAEKTAEFVIVEEKIEQETVFVETKEEPAEIDKTQPETVAEQPEIEKKTEQKNDFFIAESIVQNRDLDLKQAFSIADRFRFQRELFDGNGENFSKHLANFNEMKTLEQAQNYIVQNLKLDLETPAIQAFIDILKRKLN